MPIPDYDQEIEKRSPSYIENFTEEDDECEHRADDYILNENGEWVFPKCHPELLED